MSQFENYGMPFARFQASMMAAGLSTTLWSMEDIVALIDAQAEPAKKRGPYKQQVAKAA